MTKSNKAKQNSKPTIQINRNRGGGKKRPDLFANIRNLEHPLDNLFPGDQNFAQPEFPSENLDSQDFSNKIFKLDTFGDLISNTLDSQVNLRENPNQSDKDSQTQTVGYPTTKTLDNQTQVPGYPIQKKSDNQTTKNIRLDSQTKQKKTDWKKYDTKRATKGVFLRTNDDLTARFKQFCVAKDWDFSYGTELAWNKLMADLDSQSYKDLDSMIARDNRRLLMMFKTKSEIVNLYLAYTTVFNEISDANSKGKRSLRWTSRDDENAFQYNKIDPLIIELGIIQTQMKRGFGESKIQGFKYYTDEIEKVLTSGMSEEMLAPILQYQRQIWKTTTKREVDLGFLENGKEV